MIMDQPEITTGQQENEATLTKLSAELTNGKTCQYDEPLIQNGNSLPLNGRSNHDGKRNGHVMTEQCDRYEASQLQSIQNESKLKETTGWLPVQKLMPKLVPTKSKDEVPMLFREPHVEGGFRELHQPWSYYVCSVFQLHNESMNVWTHLLAVVLMTSKLWKFWYHIDFLQDPYSWPLMSGLMCGIFLFAFSSGAHCLQSKSELVHYTAFMVDYAGIGLYGFGSVIVHLWYCSEPVFYDSVKDFFIPLGGTIALVICYCCSVAKVIYSRPYPFRRKIWQMAPVCGVYVLLIAPIFHRLFTCYVYGEDCNDSIPYHIKQVFWFILSGLFFASDFPQRLKPGTCDHFFHSHQIFHVCIMICTLMQMDGVFIDFQTRPETFRQRLPPTISSAFGPVFLVCLAEFICIMVFVRKIQNKLEIIPSTSKKEN